MEDVNEIFESFDKGDYDIVKELIPYFFNEAWDEFLRENHIFITTRNPLFTFNLADRIDFYLVEKGWDCEIELVNEIIAEYYNVDEF